MSHAFPEEIESTFGFEPVTWLESATLCVPYIPDFLLRDLCLYFAPSLDDAREVYHSLPPSAMDRWNTYLTKKGVKFLNSPIESRGAEGPYLVRPEGFRLEIIETGRFFAAKPALRLADDRSIPIVSVDKRRPFNPWKPNYIRAVNFIKKYSPVRPIPKLVEYCLWEIEECGEIPGSTSWENAELLLIDVARDSDDVREVLADVFATRPEDFPLGSGVYLDVLGRSGDEGFAKVCELHSHPQRFKRQHVAIALGKLGRTEGLATLVTLLDDHELDVRRAALCAIGKVGVPAGHEAHAAVASYLEDGDIELQVWACEALLRGGDSAYEKQLLNLVKEKPLPLYAMGELGGILRDLGLVQAVPFLIKRLRADEMELQDDAAEVLRDLTGLDAGFSTASDPESRREATKQWKSWWEDYKRTRKRDPA